MSNDPKDRLGAVIELPNGDTQVRFERQLNHPVERVWQALTDPADLQSWFPGMNFDPRPGGRYEIWFSDACEGPAHATGTIAEFDPPHALTIGSMRYELSPTEDGCLLVFTDIVNFDDPRENRTILLLVLGGWHKYLDVLEFALEGGRADPRREPEFDYRTVTIPGLDD